MSKIQNNQKPSKMVNFDFREKKKFVQEKVQIFEFSRLNMSKLRNFSSFKVSILGANSRF